MRDDALFWLERRRQPSSDDGGAACFKAIGCTPRTIAGPADHQIAAD